MNEKEYIKKLKSLKNNLQLIQEIHKDNFLLNFTNIPMLVKVLEIEIANPQFDQKHMATLNEMVTMVDDIEKILNATPSQVLDEEE